MYDEPLDELQGLPRIVLERLRRGGIRTVQEAAAWLREPHGLALDHAQIELLRNAVRDWNDGVDHGFQRSDTD